MKRKKRGEAKGESTSNLLRENISGKKLELN